MEQQNKKDILYYSKAFMDIIVKLIILGFFLKMYLDKKLTNKMIIIPLISVAFYLFLYIVYIVAQLPQLCGDHNSGGYDLCNYRFFLDWDKGNIFWLFNNIGPQVIFAIILYYLYKEGVDFD